MRTLWLNRKRIDKILKERQVRKFLTKDKMMRLLKKQLPLTEDERFRVEAKINALEQMVDIEVRVAITQAQWVGIQRKARTLFRKLEMDKTEKHNGVLVLLNLKRRELLIYGDRVVHEAVGQELWDEVRDVMVEQLRQNELAQGLCLGLHKLGQKLRSVLSVEGGSRDELSNKIVFDL